MKSTEGILTDRRARKAERLARVCEKFYPAHVDVMSRFRQAILARASLTQSVLDIGCGRNAWFLRPLAREFGSALGIDPEVEDRSEGNLKLLNGSVYDIPLPDSSVDVVYMGNVIEHLDDPKHALAECLRVLRPSGVLISLAPNKWFPLIAAGRLLPHWFRWRILGRLLGRSKDSVFPAYYRANSKRAMLKLCRTIGFIPAKLDYISEKPFYLEFSPLCYRIWAFLDQRCFRFRRLAWLRHFILCELQKQAHSETVRIV
jgi:SAM-dependent methyltransferase